MAAQHPLSRSRVFRLLTALFILVSTLLIVCPRNAGAVPNIGKWSPKKQRSHIQIHMTLMRGDDSPYHSRIVTWGGLHEIGIDGEEIGWRPGADDCGEDTWNSNSFTFGIGAFTPGVRIFCNGHTHLADGRLLSAGGDDDVHERGIRDARTFQAGSNSQGGSWTRPPSDANRMNHERYYPTVTSLRDGRAIVVGGARAPQLWTFGGRRDPPSYRTGKELHRLGRVVDGGWDRIITPVPDPVHGDPGLREGHTAVRLTEGASAQVLFGGKTASGNTDDNQVWELKRDPISATDNDYTYRWSRRSTATSPQLPNGRCDHVAVALEATAGNYTDMVIYGGQRQPAGNVLAEFWRLYRDGQQNWVWEPVDESGSAASGPGQLYGHTAVYHRASRRMFVFGGSASTSGNPTNDDVWYFTFANGTFARGTWGKLTITGTRPTPRLNHTMVIDPDPDTDPNTIPAAYDFALWVFGGDATSTLWKLQVNGNEGKWYPKSLSPPPDNLWSTPPQPRSGHAAYFDNAPSAQRLYIFGGEGAGVDEHVYTHKIGDAGWTTAGKAAVKLSDFTMDVDATAPDVVPYSRLPEIYTPGAGGSPGTWTLQESAVVLSSLDKQYPVQFLVPGTSIPGGGGRLMKVGPDSDARYLDIPATGLAGAWQLFPNGNCGFSPWSGVIYEQGKILIAGGGPTSSSTPVGTTKTLDVSGTAGWQPQQDMASRKDHTLIMLPTGQVLATGGTGLDVVEGSQVLVPRYRPQIWTQGQGWTSSTTPPTALAADDIKREYHSTALLLPDGRVLTGGGTDDNYDYSVNPPVLISEKLDYFVPHICSLAQACLRRGLKLQEPLLISSTASHS